MVGPRLRLYRRYVLVLQRYRQMYVCALACDGCQRQRHKHLKSCCVLDFVTQESMRREAETLPPATHVLGVSRVNTASQECLLCDSCYAHHCASQALTLNPVILQSHCPMSLLKHSIRCGPRCSEAQHPSKPTSFRGLNLVSLQA